ncbi:MAG TPA: monovalent cation/H+ antiporter subunit A [Planctomycetaceae bacterium]|nr:monovalent cation/H+ antiporter subunit A [Planctomycetaceae bacterium]
MSLILIVLLPFLGAILPALMIRSGRDACAIATGSVTTLSLALLLTNVPAVFRGETIRNDWTWMSRLGLDIQFFVDGLGLLFATMILGIGLLVIIYARFYLSENDAMGNFYTYLLLFQGAMVGIVLSNNILLMLIFWELTSLSSFLLIGFWGHTPAGRQGARMALTVTGCGGLALIGGMMLVGHIVGSYELTDVLASGDAIRQSQYYHWVLTLVLIGCFTKSAQFPFHFWLPHAMAAPTPVSAYLHSATMVKAGVFLMARMWPVLSGTPEWFYVVATTGLITMVIGAVIALFKDDLKGLLAYSTVSHLGLMTMLLGFSSPLAVVACVLHIINHATFKAALFMNAGIVDHETGTRDIKRLGGLFQLMPATAIMGMIAAASMGGLPPLNGFLSKEMMLEQAAHTAWGGTTWTLAVAVTLGSVFSFGYSLRYIVQVYLGKPRDDYPRHPHDPGIGLWLAPTLLVALVITIGLFPETFVGTIVRTASFAVLRSSPPEFHLALWHGMTPAVVMSIVAILGGSLMLVKLFAVRTQWDRLAIPEAKAVFDSAIDVLASVSRQVTGGLHNGSLQRYLFATIATSLLVGIVAFASHNFEHGTRSILRISPAVFVGWLLLLGACGLVVAKHNNRLFALIVVNVIGLIASLVFIYFSAPDLALTQISVEVVTLILMLLALYFLPKKSVIEITQFTQIRNGLLACAVGVCAGGLTWATMTRDFTTISEYYWENSIPGSGGKNVVNVILVDFRGFDTFGEIMVLGIAALIIYAILDGMLRGPMLAKLKIWSSGEVYSPNRHPIVMVVVTRVMLPLSLMVAAFIFLRGHNSPGGGFIAALVVSIALVMQYMASGFGWAAKQVRFDYHALIGAGGLIAAATGISAMVFDLPFLTSGYEHFHWPIVGDFELSSAMAFDLGVFLTVVGAVMLALAQLSQLGESTNREATNDEPMDYNPAVPHERRANSRRAKGH